MPRRSTDSTSTGKSMVTNMFNMTPKIPISVHLWGITHPSIPSTMFYLAMYHQASQLWMWGQWPAHLDHSKWSANGMLGGWGIRIGIPLRIPIPSTEGGNPNHQAPNHQDKIGITSRNPLTGSSQPFLGLPWGKVGVQLPPKNGGFARLRQADFEPTMIQKCWF